MRTYYDILGITRSAPAEIVKAVYRAWMHALKLHPDLGGDEALAREIGAAYDTLKDPKRRAEYDRRIAKELQSAAGDVGRRAPRFRVDAVVAYCAPSENEWHAARVYDASVLGLRLRSASELKAGMHVAIAFSCSAMPAVEASVKWSRAIEGYDDGRFECGVEFYRPVADILKMLGG